MPLLKQKSPTELLQDLQKPLAALEALFQDQRIPPVFRREMRRFIRKNNWRRLLYLRTFGMVRANTLRKWLNAVLNAVTDIEERANGEIENASLRKRCLATLELLEDACYKLEERLPVEMQPAYGR